MKDRTIWTGVAVLGVLAILLCPTLSLSFDPNYRQTPLADETHLGSSIYPSHFVTLRLLSSQVQEVFKRMRSDGTFDPDEFVVPDKQVLIITDVEVRSHADPMQVELRINGQTVYIQQAQAADTTFPRIGEHFTAGIVVPMGKKLEFAGLPADVFVRGYLTRSR